MLFGFSGLVLVCFFVYPNNTEKLQSWTDPSAGTVQGGSRDKSNGATLPSPSMLSSSASKDTKHSCVPTETYCAFILELLLHTSLIRYL